MESSINLNNKEEENNNPHQRYGLMELEEMLKNNLMPPGIMQFDDLPPEVALEASQSVIQKAKKPWESNDNQLTTMSNNADELFGISVNSEILELKNDSNDNQNEKKGGCPFKNKFMNK